MPEKTITLPDGREIIPPDAISLSGNTAAFDELEYELWDIVKQYFAALGIQLKPNEDDEDDTPDFYTVKAMQDALLDVLKESGVNITD